MRLVRTLLIILSGCDDAALLCYVIILLDFVISLAISSRLVILPLYLGETETLTVGNGGNPFCVDCGAVIRVFSNY